MKFNATFGISHFVLGEFQRYVLKDGVAPTFINFIFDIPNGHFSTLNPVILYAKYYIFTTSCKNGILSLALFQKVLKHYYEIEQNDIFKTI